MGFAFLAQAGHPPERVSVDDVLAQFAGAGRVMWVVRRGGAESVYMAHASWDESLDYAPLNSIAAQWSHRAVYGPAVWCDEGTAASLGAAVRI